MQLPRLRDGDWLMFPYAGAYTIASASNYTKGAFLQPVRLFLFSCKADKGWGDVLPQAAVVSMLSIPHTIPERDMREHEDEVAVDEDDGHQPGSYWSEGMGPIDEEEEALDGLLAPLSSVGLGSIELDASRSGSLQPGQSMQRLLHRVFFKPRA
uniref:Orn/DAP/Arg decarboxylase 2 C-terminal domain-containing protein n=1 Tax=Tetradesmus obliquus TaxID=3088 RepID=A0A383W006_TETOB|eukprot:jgi/Sobl393_1/18062/SZX71017.1